MAETSTKSEERLIILHMSDLHFGWDGDENERANRYLALNGLLDLLANLKAEWKPNCISISGDIGWKGQDSDYRAAKEWITRLLKTLELAPDALFMCPGNHDMDRAVAKRNARPTTSDEADNVFGIPIPESYIKPFQAFIDFCKSLGVPEYKLGDFPCYLVGCRSFKGIHFVAYNSAWCSKDDDDKQKLWLGLPQLRYMESKGQLPSPRQLNDWPPIIAFFHHPRDYFREEELQATGTRPNTFDYMARRCHLFFTGHTHGEVREADKFAGGAWHLSSGATFAGASHFNFFRIIQVQNNRLVYQTFQLDPRSADGEWKVVHEKRSLIFKSKSLSKAAIERASSARAITSDQVPLPLLVQSNLTACIQATLREFWDRKYGGFYYSLDFLGSGVNPVIRDSSKRLEDNAFICWALLCAKQALPNAIDISAMRRIVRCLDKLYVGLLLPDGGLGVKTDQRWQNLISEVEAEDIGVYCIASSEAYVQLLKPRYADRARDLIGYLERTFWSEEQGAFMWRGVWDQKSNMFLHKDRAFKWVNAFLLISYSKACLNLHDNVECEAYRRYLERIQRLLDFFLGDEANSSTSFRDRLGDRKHSLFANSIYLYGLLQGYRVTGDRRAIREFNGGSLEVVAWLQNMEDREHGGLKNYEKILADNKPPKNILSISAALFVLNEWYLENGEMHSEIRSLIDRHLTHLMQKGFLGKGVAGHYASETWSPFSSDTHLACQAWMILAMSSFLRRSHQLYS